MQLRFASFAVINLRRDLHPQECARAGRTTETAGLQGRRFDGARILLVDDLELNRVVAVEILRKLGAGVCEVADGEQALAQLALHTWDLVLMDLHMPVLDGLSAMRRLADFPPERRPPVVALTASVMEEDRVRCREAGMVDFIVKPVDADNLQRVLARWIPDANKPGPKVLNATLPLPLDQPARAAANTALRERMAPVCVALRGYLLTQELVPDELTDQLREAAAQAMPDTRWQRLFDLILDFDHAQALRALDAALTEQGEHEPAA